MRKGATNMAATTFPRCSPRRAARWRAPSRSTAKEAKYELLKNIRIPVYAISTVAFPLMFYVLFGIVLGSGNPANRNDNATYMLATMGCFGVMAVALFGFGVSLAIERGQGWLQVKRASPMPVSAYFLAKLFSAVVFSTVIMLLLLAIGFTFGGVRMPLATAAKLVGILVAGSIPFSAMGLAIGYFAKPNSAPGAGEPDLPAHVVLLRAVDSAVHAAARAADVCQGVAAVSPQPVGAEHGGNGHESHSGMGTRRGADRVHPALPRSGSLGIPARRREDVRMKQWSVISGSEIAQSSAC